MGYPFREIEKKWRLNWKEAKTFLTDDRRQRPKYYVLDMFPYPSGQGLHVGHLKGYVATDIVSRYKRMQGFAVLHPMGWDAFGLPAERQASRENLHPEKLVERNIDIFRSQLEAVGLSYDWDREFSTTDKEYYKWTQWLFKKLYERGLAYQADVPVNWCPALGTVLANEEVKDGRYIETGDMVERRVMKQWMLKITEYADRLLNDLDGLDWPESIKDMQRAWIGRSEGAVINFSVDGGSQKIDVFSTRPDTLWGATYLVLAPEHPLVSDLTSNEQSEAVAAYVKASLSKSERERLIADDAKSGVFTGSYAKNPINGKIIPVYVSDYVLIGAGTGAIFGCPAHDQRDYDFAKFFNLEMLPVVKGGDVAVQAYVGDGPHINSGSLNGLHTKEASQAAIRWLEETNNGKSFVSYRLRDWLFSRQRYWGEPFPFIYDQNGQIKEVPDSQLPVELPIISDWENMKGSLAPLASCKDWVNTTDPETGAPATREANTMPQWAGSSWYFLRFCDPKNTNAAWSDEAQNYWMPVDLYMGGVEHATLHLLYARFWHKVIYDLGLVSTPEPFKKLRNQGMITARSFRDARGKYYYPHEVERHGDEWVTKEGRLPLETQIEKMSKSRYNVTNPDDIVAQYGADSLRVFEAFLGPVEKGGIWQDDHVIGVSRFLDRVYDLVERQQFVDKNTPALEQLLHQTVARVSEDLENLSLNTAVSKLMVLSNEFGKQPHTKQALSDFVVMLAPFAPFLAEECWEKLGNKGSIAHASWPVADQTLMNQNCVKIAVQVDGKMRGLVEVASGVSKEDLVLILEEHEQLGPMIKGKEFRRIVHVPNKIVNFVPK